MKLSLIGHLSFDVLHAPDGTEREEGGGLFRALQVLAGHAGRGDAFTPVAGVTRKELPEVRDRLAALAGVETDGLYTHETAVHRIHYYRRPEGGVVACTHELAPPVPFARIKPHLDTHGVLINMISGVDITLETLDEIRMAVRHEGIPIHLDMHSLTLGVNDRHERFRRPLAEWRRWAFMIDTVQMNEEEVRGLTVEGLDEERTVGHMLMLGVKGVLVTRGARGLSVYMNEHKKVVRTDIPGVEGVADSTAPGHGDMFGASFLYHYVKNNNILAAAQSAQTAAMAGSGT